VEETDVLECAADALLGDSVGRGASDIATIEIDLPARWSVDAGDDVEACRFPSSVGTDKTEQIAFF
jgi:hypothetical protein